MRDSLPRPAPFAPPSPIHLAVDAGGTSTRAVLVAESGRCVGYGIGGPGNPTSSGPQVAAESVCRAVDAALSRAGADGGAVASVVLAMAGSGGTRDTSWVAGPLSELGVCVGVRFSSDLLATFCSGTPALSGYGVVAGTGASAVRVENGRVVATSDGLGWLLGDVGSGFWVGHQVVRESLASLDGRAPSTRLAGLLLAELGIADDGLAEPDGRRTALREAVTRLYATRPVQLARFAPLAFAASGDPAADRIVQEAAAGLAHTLDAVRLPGLDGPVVLGGGTVAQQHGLPELVAPGRPHDVVLVPDGAAGAAVVTLREAGVSVDEAVFAVLITSLSTLR